MSDTASSGALWLVNRQHTLAADFEPDNLAAAAEFGVPVADISIRLQRCACVALTELLRRSRAEGAGEIVLYSGYRSFDEQKLLYENKVRRLCLQGMSYRAAQVRAATVVAPPGASEHQLGLAADVVDTGSLGMQDPLVEDFAKTALGAWLDNNAHESGFVIRYPADKQETTGVIYEPWHLRYVGQVHARRMVKGRMCLEEYLYEC